MLDKAIGKLGVMRTAKVLACLHIGSLASAFATVPKPHVLAQMSMFVPFMGKEKVTASLHICLV